MANVEQKEFYCEKHHLDYIGQVVQIGGKEVSTNCPECQKESDAQIDHELTQQALEHKQKVFAKNFERSGIPPRYTTRHFGNFKAETDAHRRAWNMAKAYADNITANMESGAGLILSGKPGTGKTHLACSVANQFLTNGGNVLFITVTAMIRKIRETYRNDSRKTEQEAINQFRDIDLLIIDEIGVQKGSDSEEHLLFEVINERYNYFKPTILISNLNAEQIKSFIGERALDRMRENGGKFIAFDWDSYRSKVAADDALPNADKAAYQTERATA